MKTLMIAITMLLGSFFSALADEAMQIVVIDSTTPTEALLENSQIEN